MITELQLQKHFEDTGHNLFGPSSLPSIALCPAKAGETLAAPKDTPSKWAIEGTALHFIMEQVCNPDLDTEEILKDVSEERLPLVLDNLEFIDEKILAHHKAPKIFLEIDSSLAAYDVPEVEGTADYVAHSYGRLDVVDWKFGSGVQVYAKDNLQAAAYAAGLLPSDDIEEVHIWIAQAPLNHFDEWVVTPQYLEELMVDKVWSIVRKAREANPPYNPSLEACRFCNARLPNLAQGYKGCQPRQKYLQKIQLDITVAAASPQNITMDRYIELLDKADAIGQAIKDVRMFAEKTIKDGGKFGDYKMVSGRGSRNFIDAVEAETFLKKHLKDKAYAPRKLLSVAQAEKADRSLKKDVYFKELWEKRSGKPILVKGSDKRKALQYGAASAFQKHITN